MSPLWLSVIPDVIVAGLLVYVLNRLANLSDRVSKIAEVQTRTLSGAERTRPNA